MISKFNKNGATALYKRKFSEYLDDYDYDGAMDVLLKYSEATRDPDFHLVCGMLYMLMTQDSDEGELLVLAYREFMMHVSAHPDCRAAYRNALGAAILRRDHVSVTETKRFIEANGMDCGEIIDELAASGIEVFMDDGTYVDYETLFKREEYGSILAGGKTPDATCDAAPSQNDEKQPETRVIRFKGNPSAVGGAGDSGGGSGKVMPLKTDSSEDRMDDLLKLLFDMEEHIGDDDTVGDGFNAILDDVFDADESAEKSEIRAKLAIRDAEQLCYRDKFDEALQALDRVPRDKSRIHYCAECARAHIYIVTGKLDSARAALDVASEIYEKGALVGTLLCKLYEEQGKTSLIPQALKNIDVFDFADGEHVYAALETAIEYCTPDDALDLAAAYADEFNTFDLRLMYAQLLYNAGETKDAKDELYSLSRVLYDDFNIQYFYALACGGTAKMPLDTDCPGDVLDYMVENFLSDVRAPGFAKNDELIQNEVFRFGLEMFLTLEYRNKKKILKIMFDVLRMLARDRRLETAMRNAIVSPYVEPLVKAVILSELLANGSDEFLVCTAMCPLSQTGVTRIAKGYPREIYIAYALTVVFTRFETKYLVGRIKKLLGSKKLKGVAPVDIACYLWNDVKTKVKFSDKEIDSRLCYVFGLDSRSKMTEACERVGSRLDGDE